MWRLFPPSDSDVFTFHQSVKSQCIGKVLGIYNWVRELNQN